MNEGPWNSIDELNKFHSRLVEGQIGYKSSSSSKSVAPLEFQSGLEDPVPGDFGAGETNLKRRSYEGE